MAQNLSKIDFLFVSVFYQATLALTKPLKPIDYEKH